MKNNVKEIRSLLEDAKCLHVFVEETDPATMRNIQASIQLREIKDEIISYVPELLNEIDRLNEILDDIRDTEFERHLRGY